MRKIVSCRMVTGDIAAPASKSEAQRAIAMALLSSGESVLRGMTPCADTLAALGVAVSLGARGRWDEDVLRIRGGLEVREGPLDCGESGLCLRMFAPVVSLGTREVIMTGRGTLLRRPLEMVEQPLRDLGAQASSENGRLPLRICGPLKGGKTWVDGAITSQFLTGLLMALPLVGQDSLILVEGLRSHPYIELTMSILRRFGIRVYQEGYRTFHIPGGQCPSAAEFRVEGDWSAGAFLAVAGALGGEIRVRGLSRESVQADRAVVDILREAGAEVLEGQDELTVKQKELRPFHFDATDCPDLVPPLVALAAGAKGISAIRGVRRLRHKESDRATALSEEFQRVGVRVWIEGDLLLIQGGGVANGVVDSRGDHRIAMAGAVLSCMGGARITIEGAEAVNKSYPAFFEDFARIGGSVA